MLIGPARTSEATLPLRPAAKADTLMSRQVLLLSLLLLATGMRAQRIGVVLSGGGAVGLTHIGVLMALEDNDIPIDYITGSSIGR